MTCSEQSAGIVVLLALAFFVSATCGRYLIEAVQPQSEHCVTVMGYTYQGRDENGRPQFDYPKRTVCYE